MAKVSARTSRIVDVKYLGKEPTFDPEEVLTGSKLIRALSWYNHFKDTDAAKNYLIEYAKSNNIKISAGNHSHPNTQAWIARMIQLGAKFDSPTMERFHSYIDNLKKQPREIVANDNQNNQRTATDNKLSQWLPDFEEAIDNYKSKFVAYDYFKNNQVPQIYVKQIGEWYSPLLSELKEAYLKQDEQLKEAYKNYSRTDLKALITFVESIINDVDSYLGNVKKERKPRKPRTKSIDTILKHFKYMKHSDVLKVSSEDPQKILGGQYLYVLNTKQNILTMFVAADQNGFGIQRTAITNYDEKQSISKKVGRRLDVVINQISAGTKRTRTKVLDSVKTNPTKLSDRLSDHHLIIKVDK